MYSDGVRRHARGMENSGANGGLDSEEGERTADPSVDQSSHSEIGVVETREAPVAQTFPVSQPDPPLVQSTSGSTTESTTTPDGGKEAREALAGERSTVHNYQHFVVSVFTITEINKDPTLLPNTTLGFRLYDHLDLASFMHLNSLSLLSTQGRMLPNAKCDRQDHLISVIGGLDSQSSKEIASILGIYKIPQRWRDGASFLDRPSNSFQQENLSLSLSLSFSLSLSLSLAPTSSSALSPVIKSPIHQPKKEDVAKSLRELQMTTLVIQMALTALQASQEMMQASQEAMATRLETQEFYEKFRAMLEEEEPGVSKEGEKSTEAMKVTEYHSEEGEIVNVNSQQEVQILDSKEKKKEDVDVTQIQNYRPISLLNVDDKIFTSILAERLKKLLIDFIHPDQNGFLPKRQMKNNLRTILDILEYDEIHTEKPMALLFMDAHKTFDHVNWQFLKQQMTQMEFGEKFMNAISSIYQKQLARILINGELSNSIEIQKGTSQGCLLSPLLFILILEVLNRSVRDD
ncbi:LINE-1 retrotransposable element ORF2 protein [Varanus komodoensis]|nr:LINE-1 retrotransposable element ORF2 protein [Varanus komodoensis]